MVTFSPLTRPEASDILVKAEHESCKPAGTHGLIRGNTCGFADPRIRFTCGGRLPRIRVWILELTGTCAGTRLNIFILLIQISAAVRVTPKLHKLALQLFTSTGVRTLERPAHGPLHEACDAVRAFRALPRVVSLLASLLFVHNKSRTSSLWARKLLAYQVSHSEVAAGHAPPSSCTH